MKYRGRRQVTQHRRGNESTTTDCSPPTIKTFGPAGGKGGRTTSTHTRTPPPPPLALPPFILTKFLSFFQKRNDGREYSVSAPFPDARARVCVCVYVRVCVCACACVCHCCCCTHDAAALRAFPSQLTNVVSSMATPVRPLQLLMGDATLPVSLLCKAIAAADQVMLQRRGEGDLFTEPLASHA